MPTTDSQLSKILVQLARIEEHLVAHTAKDEATFERLFGNGQPGIISTFSNRLRKLEGKVTWYVAVCIGGGSVLIFLVNFASRYWK